MLLLVFEQIIGFALEPVTFQHYLELELEQKKVEDKQPDLVFIGNSRVSTTFIPSVFSDNMKEVSYEFKSWRHTCNSLL